MGYVIVSLEGNFRVSAAYGSALWASALSSLKSVSRRRVCCLANLRIYGKLTTWRIEFSQGSLFEKPIKRFGVTPKKGGVYGKKIPRLA